MDKPRDRRDRTESAFALEAEKADGHARRTRHAQGGAQAGHRASRRRWHQYLDFTRSAGREAGIVRARHGLRRRLPAPTTTKSISMRRLSVFATQLVPPFLPASV